MFNAASTFNEQKQDQHNAHPTKDMSPTDTAQTWWKIATCPTEVERRESWAKGVLELAPSSPCDRLVQTEEYHTVCRLFQEYQTALLLINARNTNIRKSHQYLADMVIAPVFVDTATSIDTDERGFASLSFQNPEVEESSAARPITRTYFIE